MTRLAAKGKGPRRDSTRAKEHGWTNPRTGPSAVSNSLERRFMQDINQGKTWTQADDHDLRLEVSTGEAVLCRSSEEVIKRAAELGLRWDGA
jgi:hypothetical protein